MLRLLHTFLSLPILLACSSGPAQAPGQQPAASASRSLPDAGGQELTVAFYNIENLFDTQDDPKTDDAEWLPGSEVKWDDAKYRIKLSRMAEAIASIGSGGPDLLGVAEAENEAVLRDLAAQPAIAARKYQIAHVESEDERGIDVALLYDPAKFRFESLKAYQVDLPGEDDRTRPVLAVGGKAGGEWLYVLVNHWPSRSEGQQESEPNRLAAARTALQAVSEIRSQRKDAHVILMGDFNDDPHNASIAEVLGARSAPAQLPAGSLFNCMAALHNPESAGTLTYQGKWNLFDQIIISESLLRPGAKLQYVSGSAAIHNPEFLQVGGDGRSKDAPRRAIYRGEFQDRGYSDHFPVYIRLSTR